MSTLIPVYLHVEPAVTTHNHAEIYRPFVSPDPQAVAKSRYTDFTQIFRCTNTPIVRIRGTIGMVKYTVLPTLFCAAIRIGLSIVARLGLRRAVKTFERSFPKRGSFVERKILGRIRTGEWTPCGTHPRCGSHCSSRSQRAASNSFLSRSVLSD